MADEEERALERRVATGDRSAARSLQAARCRRGVHDGWVPGDEIAKHCACPADPGTHRCHLKVCSSCGAPEDEVKRRLQTELCQRGEHEYVPSNERPDDCGCPADPGIHGCHRMYCRHCGGPEVHEEEDEDICGLCSEPGADKMAKWTGGGVYWPGEQRPDTDIVHSGCESEECRRAHSELSTEQREAVLRAAWT